MKRALCRVICLTVFLAFLCVAPGPLAGCGSEDGPHLPDVTTGVTVGPGPREATMSIRSSGSGAGVAALALTYPDGHRQLVGSGVLEDGIGLSYGLKDLPPGSYTYTVYGLATPSVPKSPALPAEERVDENIIASSSFVID